MNILGYLSIFLSPIIGFLLYDNKYNCEKKEGLLIYSILLLISNLVACFIILYLKAYLYLYFTLSFFIKYTLLTLVSSIIIAIIFIVIKDNVKIHFISSSNAEEKEDHI